MKTLIITSFLLFNSALAFDCKRGEGITKVAGGFLYSEECHIKVGQVVESEALAKQEIVALREAITLKDLAFNQQTDRVNMWKSAALDLEKTILVRQKFNKYENWLFMGLGILVSGVAVYGASALK